MAAMRPLDLFTPHPKLGPGGGFLDPLSDEEYSGLKASIARDGIMQPIVVAIPENVIIDGHHRWRIAKELGMEKLPVVTVETGDADAHLDLGLALNVNRRHMTTASKRAAAAARLRANPEQSDRAVAQAVGLHQTTVGSVRAELEAAGDVSKLDTRTDTTGRKQPARKPSPTGSKKPGSGNGKKSRVTDITAKILAGMAMDGGKAEDIAKAVGLPIASFVQGRKLLLLADDPNLSAEEAEHVASAVATMEQEGTTARAYKSVESLVDQKWGSASERRGTTPERASMIRMDHFMRAYGTLVQACKMAADVEVPILAPDQAASLADELGEAINGAKHLQRKIRGAIA